MQEPLAEPADRFPRWLVLGGSAAIILHFAAVVCGALAVPSGPLLSREGPEQAMPPRFASAIADLGPTYYLTHLRLAYNFRNASRPQQPGVFFKVRLKDADGREMKVLQFPDPDANFWVHQRQSLLVQALADDQNVPPPQGEVIAGPGQQVPTVQYWDAVEGSSAGGGPGGRLLRLRKVPQHLAPREREVMRPSDWSLLLVRSYARYLCRTEGAASAEILRHTREPVSPGMLFVDNPQPTAFEELVSNFGELPR